MTEELGGLQSMGSQRVGHDRACMHACFLLSPNIGQMVALSSLGLGHKGNCFPIKHDAGVGLRLLSLSCDRGFYLFLFNYLLKL